MEKADDEGAQKKLDDDGSVAHVSLDIGGSLIKMVYFSSNSTSSDSDSSSNNNKVNHSSKDGIITTSNGNGQPHFVTFETSKIDDCIHFISSKQLQYYHGHRHNEDPTSYKNIIKATGGGAFKFADLFKEKLGIALDKVDEMDCLVRGANFLLKAVHDEAFTHIDGRKEYVQIDDKDLYPYLLVNIGSGTSMIKVDNDTKFERVSGTSLGGGTFWGLGKLLSARGSFDELLELSHRGNNREIDLLVGDIYGGNDYSKIGLASTAIASSFGKVVSENKELKDYKPEDITRSLLRMISNDIGQIAHLNAQLYGLKRIFFSGYFIRGQAYTMDTLSDAVNFWTKGEEKAMFLRHEGFLGALGAFLSYEKSGFADVTHQLLEGLRQNPYRTEDGL